jgi:aminoglycoside phosphotransferase (APT) family kinase protein
VTALDIEDPPALVAYLRATGRVEEWAEVGVRVLSGGVSNRTVLVEGEGAAWVVKQALPRLRVAVEWFASPDRAHREALGLRWLGELAPPGSTTPFAWEDPAHHLVAMAAVPRPHENWKEMLLAGRVEAGHAEQFGRLGGMVHRRAWERRDELPPDFADTSAFEALRLEPYYEYAASRLPTARAFLEGLAASTRSRRLTLVHGDFSPKNVLVHEDRLVLLDHEVIHQGDPGFDVGFGLTHLLAKAHHLPARRDALAGAARAMWAAYDEALGDVPWRAEHEERAAHHAVGCLLARVDGRSPLEYLDEEERARQRRAGVALARRPPAGVDELVARFLDGVRA